MNMSWKSAVASVLCVLSGCGSPTTTTTAKSRASVPVESKVVPQENPNAAPKEKQVVESHSTPATSTDVPADNVISVAKTSGGLTLKESFTITLLHEGQRLKIVRKEYLVPKANEATARFFIRTVTFGCLNENMEVRSPIREGPTASFPPEDLQKFMKEQIGSELNTSLSEEQSHQIKQDGFLYFAVRVEFRSGDDPLPIASNDELDKSFRHRKENFADWDDRMKFLKQLEPGQSGEFGGWFYQKIELSQVLGD